MLDRWSRTYNLCAKVLHRFYYTPSSRGYNITISHERKFIWFRVAKTGTRSVLDQLRGHNVKLDAEHPMGVHYPLRLYRDYFKFAFVRNPWDRLVSCWNNKIVDQNWWKLPEEQLEHLQDFGNFVDYVSEMDLDHCDVHLHRQSSIVDLNQLDFLGRFENLSADVGEAMSRIGLPRAELPKLNASKNRRDYRSYYTDALAARVAALYERDVRLFNYQF